MTRRHVGIELVNAQEGNPGHGPAAIDAAPALEVPPVGSDRDGLGHTARASAAGTADGVPTSWRNAQSPLARRHRGCHHGFDRSSSPDLAALRPRG